VPNGLSNKAVSLGSGYSGAALNYFFFPTLLLFNGFRFAPPAR
jgi:hypothetical protein